MLVYDGVWPSGKAPVFGTGIRGFESLHPSHVKMSPSGLIFTFMNSSAYEREANGEGSAIPPPQSESSCQIDLCLRSLAVKGWSAKISAARLPINSEAMKATNARITISLFL